MEFQSYIYSVVSYLYYVLDSEYNGSKVMKIRK